MAHQNIRVGDIDIRYELIDYTPPWRVTPPETILLFHGYARNMMFWQPFVSLLAGQYRVLRFDARGCGDTTKTPPGDRYSITQFVEDSIGLIDALGIDRVHWVGESSGGIVGLTAALNHPERLRTIPLGKWIAQLRSRSMVWAAGAGRPCPTASIPRAQAPRCANGISRRWTGRPRTLPSPSN